MYVVCFGAIGAVLALAFVMFMVNNNYEFLRASVIDKGRFKRNTEPRKNKPCL